MFGYIKPFKPQLRICEFDAYKAVYCGLCGQLGKSFGAAARVTLSYDFTFLSMLQFGLSDTAPQIEKRRCYVNPLHKVPCCLQALPLANSANIAAIMIYYKLLDNIHDSGFLGKLAWSALRPWTARAHNKAAAQSPEIEAIIRDSIRRQAKLEREYCQSLDAAAEPTAAAMAQIFALLSADEQQKRILHRLGYLLGRFVYICDALDDIAQDIKTGGYNPFVLRYGLTKAGGGDFNRAVTTGRDSLYMTIGEAAKAYDLLTISAFKPVLDNILQMGMRASVDEILAKERL